MIKSTPLTAELKRLNPEQLKAVEHLDGPLLVVAGPGTGKTQLLSLRAANILAKRDAAPGNILCLTYTDAGAEAMRKRLIGLIGRNAYGIQVSTFHGFASNMRTRFPQSFTRPASDRLATSLQQAEIMDDVLKGLPFGATLSEIGRDGNAYHTASLLGFISKVKRGGISYDALEGIARQNIEAATWLQEHSTLCTLVSQKASAKLTEQFEAEVERACAAAPRDYTSPVVTTPGTYVPYILHLLKTVRQTELIDEDGKTSGYAKVRASFFSGSNKEGRTLSVIDASEKLLAACEAAKQYQAILDERALYDYDDMIADFIGAVETDAALRQTLQETFTYIQVDEFQDTNGAQMRLIELLCEGTDAPNIMAVGDDDQAIMRFQGATIECINQFTERYRPEVIILKTNYRSTPKIVALGQSVAKQVEHRLDASEGKAITAFQPDGDQVRFEETVCGSAAEEYAAIAADVRSKIDAGYISACAKPDEAIAIIASKHAVLKAIIPFLIAENVPYAYRQTQSLFESECMQTMLGIIGCVSALSQGRKELAASYLPQIIASPELGGEHESSVRFALGARRERHGNWMEAAATTGDTRISEIHGDLTAWAAKAPTAPVRELLFEMAEKPMSYYRSLGSSDPLAAAEFNAGIRALLSFVEGELDGVPRQNGILHLPDIVDRLEAARKHGVSIDASLNLGTPGAVRLTTAHSSKGLEFGCVYLADADDKTWHKGAQTSKLYPSNLLLGDEKDDDDARRLLYVAITRAKRHLKLFRAAGETLRELSNEVETVESPTTAQALDSAIATDWHRSYKFDTSELTALLDPNTDVRHISASALNAFVTYQKGCANSSSFPEHQILRLPQAPQINLEFGTIVHALMEDVVNLVVGERQSLKKTVQAHREHLSWMDFPKQDVQRYLQRFDRICKTFVPWLMTRASEFRCATELKMEVPTKVGTPLFGFLDLLLIDDEAKTVRVVDYKTGFSYSISAGYERQLKFYKLMIERAPEFAGYSVLSMGDYYVEPERGTSDLHQPLTISASDEEIADLERLTDAVWSRIQAGAWDTTAFEQSKEYNAVQIEQESVRTKADKERILQNAYELWLVEHPA